jgi:small subunit ribosomal protein S16
VAVKIRLKRFGKIRAPYYRIVVANSRTKRDGRSIEEIGKYHPTENPSFIEVNSERALYWLGVGAQPSPQVEALLKITGDWGTFKGEKGAKSTLQTKEARIEFQADDKKKPVLRPKVEKPVKVEAPAEPAAVVEPTPVVEPAAAPAAAAPAAEAAPEAEPDAVVETPVAETPVEADAAADVVRAEEADDSTTTTLETPEQVGNSGVDAVNADLPAEAEPAAAAPAAEAAPAAAPAAESAPEAEPEQA